MKIAKASDQISLDKLCMLFTIGGIFGFIYEEFFYRIDLGEWVKRGSTFGPWIPIYAFGAILMFFAFRKRINNLLYVFLLSVIVSGILEYSVGYVLYTYFDGLRLWDYSVEIWNWGNINGFICIRSVVFFGVSGVFMVLVILPLIDFIKKKLGEKRNKILSLSLTSIFVLDMIIYQLVKNII